MKKSVLKSRKAWFETLPEPQRAMAIRNTKPGKLKENVINLLSALDGGFMWVETTEGHQFWEEIYLKERYGEEEGVSIQSKK